MTRLDLTDDLLLDVLGQAVEPGVAERVAGLGELIKDIPEVVVVDQQADVVRLDVPKQRSVVMLPGVVPEWVLGLGAQARLQDAHLLAVLAGEADQVEAVPGLRV